MKIFDPSFSFLDFPFPSGDEDAPAESFLCVSFRPCRSAMMLSARSRGPSHSVPFFLSGATSNRCDWRPPPVSLSLLISEGTIAYRIDYSLLSQWNEFVKPSAPFSPFTFFFLPFFLLFPGMEDGPERRAGDSFLFPFFPQFFLSDSFRGVGEVLRRGDFPSFSFFPRAKTGEKPSPPPSPPSLSQDSSPPPSSTRSLVARRRHREVGGRFSPSSFFLFPLLT